MKFQQELYAEIPGDEQFELFAYTDDQQRRRTMRVHHVFLWFDLDGDLSGAQITGTLILLNGNLAVSNDGRWTCVRVDSYDELPKQVRDALEERQTHAG